MNRTTVGLTQPTAALLRGVQQRLAGPDGRPASAEFAVLFLLGLDATSDDEQDKMALTRAVETQANQAATVRSKP